MKINISADNAIKEATAVRLGLIQANVSVTESGTQLWKEIDLHLDDIRKQYQLQDINKHEIIVAVRAAYRNCGIDPNRYRPSADSLMRRIVKGQGLYKVNNVVDVLNYISLKSGFSIGGYDADKINGPIVMGIGRPAEPYTGIGRGTLNIRNLPVLRDNLGSFGTPTSDSERTMISGNTKSILMVFFDFGFNNSLEPILPETVTLLEKYCMAEDVSTNQVNLT